jgi:hypothetical protein
LREFVTLNYVRCALSVICLATFCAVPVRAEQKTEPVTAVVLPDGRYSTTALGEMGREAGHILKRSGVSLRWRIGVPPQAVSGLLVVVTLVGRCDMDGPPAHLAPGPLGWSHESDGTLLPFTDLACDSLRGAVAAAIPAGNPLGWNILLGRAMGRVLAHELYHIVADTAQHGRDGVAQAALSPRELTSGLLELNHAQTVAVQNGLNRAR